MAEVGPGPKVSPATPLEILGDTGVISPEWMRAWVELRIARNEAAHRGDRLTAEEAASWIESAHQLASQARSSAMEVLVNWQRDTRQ